MSSYARSDAATQRVESRDAPLVAARARCDAPIPGSQRSSCRTWSSSTLDFSGTAPRGESDAEIGEERARILAERIDLDLPAAPDADETGSQAVTRQAADEVGADDAVFHDDEDWIRHYASSRTEPGRSE
jgi:hypothetical protein